MAFKRFLVCADNHGHLVNKQAVKKFKAFKEDFKPHHTIHLGDLFDLTSIRKGASESDRQLGIAEDFQAGLEFLDLGFNYLTLGNHDARLWEHAEDSQTGVMRESCQTLVKHAESAFRERRIKYVHYNVNQYLQLPEGGPKFLHGFLAGQNPAKAHFDRFGPCLVGHCHSPDTYTAKHISGGQAHVLGCMANIESMTYAERYPNRLGWRTGWGFGIINDKTGKWNFWDVVEEDGCYISPTGIL